MLCGSPLCLSLHPAMARLVRASARMASSFARASARTSSSFALQRPCVPQALRAATVGALAGGSVSCVGVGASLVMIPGLTGVMGMSQLTATATSVTVLSGSVLVTALTFGMYGQLDVGAAACLALPGMVAARLSARHASKVPDRWLRVGFAVLVLGCIPAVAMQAWEKWDAKQHRDVHDEAQDSGAEACTQQKTRPDLALRAPSARQAAAHAAVGTLTGLLTGLLGVGGTPLVMAHLALTGLPQAAVLGTSAAALAPPLLAGAAAHLRLGRVPLATLPPLAVGAAAGSCAGAGLAAELPDELLRGVLVLVLGAVGGQAVRGAAAAMLRR
uniref:Membrane transporter protein n=1 Tax=Alexandrium catenella TaxID=2925 RepID=A0A7S1RQ38_ALECA